MPADTINTMNRYARDLCRPGHDSRVRGFPCKELAGLGGGAGCGRAPEGPHRQRPSPGLGAHDPGARHLPGRDRRDRGLTSPLHPVAGARGEVSDPHLQHQRQRIGTLRGTRRRHTEQDWSVTGVPSLNRMMQGQRDLVPVGEMLLSELAPLVNAQHGIVYVAPKWRGRHSLPAAGDLRRSEAGAQPRRCAIGGGLAHDSFADARSGAAARPSAGSA